MQIKTTIMTYHYTPVKMSKIIINKKTVITPNSGKDAEKQALACIAGGDVRQYGHSGRCSINTL